MPVSIESKRSHLHFKPHQIWQVTAYSTFIAALFSISELGYSHDLKICWSSSVLSSVLTFVLASVLLPNVLTHVQGQVGRRLGRRLGRPGYHHNHYCHQYP